MNGPKACEYFQSLLVHLYHLCQKNLWNSKNSNTKRCWQERSIHLPKMERYWRKVISKHFLSKSITLWNPRINQNVILFINIQKKCTNKYLFMSEKCFDIKKDFFALLLTQGRRKVWKSGGTSIRLVRLLIVILENS